MAPVRRRRVTAGAQEGDPRCEVDRQINEKLLQNGSLRMTHVLWGGTTSDSGSVDHRVGLSIKQLGTLGGSGFITGVKAKVTVLDAEVQDCAANTTGFSQTRFPIQGFFFNDGTGDIIGFLNIHRDADGVNRISANLTRCSGGTCTGLDNPPGITF